MLKKKQSQKNSSLTLEKSHFARKFFFFFKRGPASFTLTPPPDWDWSNYYIIVYITICNSSRRISPSSLACFSPRRRRCCTVREGRASTCLVCHFYKIIQNYSRAFSPFLSPFGVMMRA